jgi:signal transduction histidine kinase
MGQTISDFNYDSLKRKGIFLVFLLLSTFSYSQNSYTNQWFSKHCNHCKEYNQDKDSILQDLSKNAWHNAHVSLAQKNFTKADYFLQIDEQTNDTLKEVLQGHLLMRLEILEEAKSHFENIFTTSDLDLKQFLSKSIGDLHYKSKEYDLARAYYQKAFEIQIPQSRYFTTEIHENLAYINVTKENYTEAQSSYEKILNIYKEYKDSLAIARVYSNLGNLYYEQYKDLVAKQYFDSAYVAVKPLSDLKLKSLITYNLYLTNEVLKNTNEAVKYLKENTDIEDSIQKQNHVWEVAKQQEAFAVAQKQSEVDLKTAERNAFLILLVAVVMILILGFLAYRRLSQQHKEIRLLNTKLDKLNTAKDQLFTIIAHDLRSPVALLKQAFQIKKFQQKDNATDLDQDIPKILDSLSMLLDNLLNWALSQSSLLHVHKDWFPLQPVLHQIQHQYEALIQEKNIQFSLSVSRSVLVNGDMELLKVALRNCLDNAIKFTPEGGSIQFSETINQENYTLSLIDSGIGIPEETLAKLFEMNARKIQKDTTGRKSSGLGLMLTQSMIQLNDGQIHIRQNPTGGTIIDITLPYKHVA